MTQLARAGWTAETILDFLKRHGGDLRSMGVARIGLFGSYARGEQKPGSDVDLLVTMEGWTWKRWTRVWSYLEDHLGVEVDLIPEEDLRPELRPHVLPEVRYAEIL